MRPSLLLADVVGSLCFDVLVSPVAVGVEGTGRTRIVVIGFKDFATALECYHSPEYAKAIELRKGSAVADIIIAEGYHGPQPTDA